MQVGLPGRFLGSVRPSWKKVQGIGRWVHLGTARLRGFRRDLWRHSGQLRVQVESSSSLVVLSCTIQLRIFALGVLHYFTTFLLIRIALEEFAKQVSVCNLSFVGQLCRPVVVCLFSWGWMCSAKTWLQPERWLHWHRGFLRNENDLQAVVVTNCWRDCLFRSALVVAATLTCLKIRSIGRADVASEWWMNAKRTDMIARPTPRWSTHAKTIIVIGLQSFYCLNEASVDIVHWHARFLPVPLLIRVLRRFSWPDTKPWENLQTEGNQRVSSRYSRLFPTCSLLGQSQWIHMQVDSGRNWLQGLVRSNEDFQVSRRLPG